MRIVRTSLLPETQPHLFPFIAVTTALESICNTIFCICKWNTNFKPSKTPHNSATNTEALPMYLANPPFYWPLLFLIRPLQPAMPPFPFTTSSVFRQNQPLFSWLYHEARTYSREGGSNLHCYPLSQQHNNYEYEQGKQ